jgi:hypothetical protein
MFKSNDLLALGFGAVAIASLLALPLLSPVSGATSSDSRQTESQGQVIESMPAGGNEGSGLSGGFPQEDPVS